MTDLQMSTKELVRTYCYSDLYDNRSDKKISVIKGRTFIELGTRTATILVGNLYKVFDSSVKSFKYLLLVGVARQNPDYYDSELSEEAAEELAAVNALIDPKIKIIVDEPFSDDAFHDLGYLFSKALQNIKFLLTEEEKNKIYC